MASRRAPDHPRSPVYCVRLSALSWKHARAQLFRYQVETFVASHDRAQIAPALT
jgi:hypothetical protein